MKEGGGGRGGGGWEGAILISRLISLPIAAFMMHTIQRVTETKQSQRDEERSTAPKRKIHSLTVRRESRLVVIE